MTGSNIIQDDPWPEDAVRVLVRLWMDGDSAGQIGKAMGKTRNAVIGKVHRLGLTRSEGTKPMITPRITKATAVKRSSFNVAIRHKPRPPTLPKVTTSGAIPPLNGNGVTLFDLKRDQCHAVIHRPPRMASDLPRYCGRPVYDETAYCEWHFHEYHQPPRPR